MKVKLIAVAVLLFCCASLARGQCTGYSANITPAALAPSDVAARGGVTATLTIQANGGVLSHNLTATAGSNTTYSWKTNNATSVSLYYSWDGGTRVLWQSNVGATGSGQLNNIGPASHTLNVYVVASGNNGSSQDVNNLTIANGAPGTIVYQDELPTNAYIQVTINFGGGSMLNNCSPCQGGSAQHCINATHTPYVTMTAVNHTSGESQSLARQQAGNIAKSNESVSGYGSIWISVLPGDTVDGTANGEIFCTMFGDLPVSGNDEWGLEWELAWTKFSTIQSTCLPTGDGTGSIGCKVTWKYMCNTNSQPPDLQPTIVFAEFDTNGNPVTLETVPPFWWGWGFGIRGHISAFTIPWIFPANVLQQYTRGHYLLLDISAGAFPSNSTIRNCTNKDKGTKPEIFPPFDQP